MIFVTGDTHIPLDISKLNTKNFPEQKQLTKEDVVVICGDFGGVWDDSREERYWRKWLDNKPFTTLFVDGNHENFDLLNTFETVPFGGGEAHRITDSIFHLMRGQIYTIGGKTVLAMGGASSHDRERRKEGRSWWRKELPSSEEIAAARRNLEVHGWRVDLVITHCAPTSIQESICPLYEADRLTDFLDEVQERLTFEKWYFGHYHQNCHRGKFHGLYDSIEKIE